MRVSLVLALTVVFAVGTLVATCAQEAGTPPADEQLIQLRKDRATMAHAPRRLMFNNDGCDALYYPGDSPVTPDGFLKRRTTPLLGSQVSAVCYCTISSGFSNFTHRTKIGTILTRAPEGSTNITQALIDQGTDPLQEVVRFCHENGKEAFWSFRMNDTHDGAHRPDKPYLLFPPLKEEHPEYLIGSLDKRPKHGSWSSVDYARPEIRDLAYKFCEEVCRNYDVDGIELDFFRHLSYFKTPAYGGRATQEELDMMTDLLRRVRRMTEVEGLKRNRPILVSIRVPDSVEYARALGLDIEQWLSEGLVDILIGSGYFQMNPWEYLVQLGHKYGVAVYCGLSESRVRGEAPPLKRQSTESYRARAMRAWQAGVDGIYIFNVYNASAPFLSEVGDPETLGKLDKLYFATVRGDRPERYLTGGNEMRNVTVLTPEAPMFFPMTGELTVDLYVGDDLSAAVADGASPQVTCYLLAQGSSALRVAMNGTPLPAGTPSERWLQFPVKPELVKPGLNKVQITTDPSADTSEDDYWNVVYEAKEKPEAPWSSDRARKNTLAEIKDGALLIADRGVESGDYLYYRYAWNVDPAQESVVEARVKVIDGWSNVIVQNGANAERITFYPDHIGTYHTHLSYEMDTTDDLHTYRIVLQDQDIKVYVDDELALDGTGKYTGTGSGPRNEVCFGAANSPNTGEALWQSIKLHARRSTVSVFDLALSVKYPAAEE